MQIIEIDITNEDDLFCKYNKKQLKEELMDYIIDNTPNYGKEKLRIVINNKIDRKLDITKLVIEELKKQYSKTLFNHKKNTIKQFLYLLVGLFALFLSTIIKETIFKEVVSIGGWVLIWTMMEIEISTDIEIINRKRKLKKLLSGEIINVN